MSRSRLLFSRAQRSIPGGVNSPVRAFRAVGGIPPFISRGQGAYVYDVDGNQYIDYLASWGPLILGHAHPVILRAVKDAAGKGTTFGATTEQEVILAEMIRNSIPGIEQIRLVSSGSESLMSAVRLARAYTQRDRIVKFAGGYHGHSDSFLVAAGSGAATFGHPSSPGVPASLAKLTTVLPYNRIDALLHFMEKHGRNVAAVIVEPVAANMGVIPPKVGFLEALRRSTRKSGALLIFDEVVTGFRVAPGGAQELFGVDADLVCLGKIVGGGLPLAAFAGPKKIMRHLSPEGPVYQAGTLSGNPIAVSAGIATLKYLQTHPPYAMLEKTSDRLVRELSRLLRNAGIVHRFKRVGSMMTLFFTGRDVLNFEDAKRCDTRRYSLFHRAMLKQGVYFPPSQFEAWFVSVAHTNGLIDQTLERAAKAIKTI